MAARRIPHTAFRDTTASLFFGLSWTHEASYCLQTVLQTITYSNFGVKEVNQAESTTGQNFYLKKRNHGHRVYESVEDSSLSQAITRILMEKWASEG